MRETFPTFSLLDQLVYGLYWEAAGEEAFHILILQQSRRRNRRMTKDFTPHPPQSRRNLAQCPAVTASEQVWRASIEGEAWEHRKGFSVDYLTLYFSPDELMDFSE